MSSQEQLVIEDEILPEIEIRELLSVEEMLEENPSFVTYNDEEIIELIHEFVQSYKKAGSFLNILKHILRPHKSVLQNIVPVLQASLKDNSGEEHVEEWIAENEEILKAPGYQLRQSLFQKLEYPLIHVPPSRDGMGFLPPRKMEVGYDGSYKHRTVVLPTDEVPQAVHSAIYEKPWVTQYTALVDRILLQKGTPETSEVPVSSEAMGTLIEQMETAKPDWDSFLSSLNVFPDHNELKGKMETFGISWDDLTEEQWMSLQEKLTSLDMPKEDLDHVAEQKDMPKYVSVNELSFVDALVRVLQTPFDKMKYGALYQAYVAAIPPQNPTMEVPLTAYEIAQGIRGTEHGKFELADVATFLRWVRTRWVMDTAAKACDAFQAMESDVAQTKLAKFTQDWKRINERYRDRTAQSFLEMYKDVAEWKRGMSTEDYEGNMNRPILTFEEMQHEYVATQAEDDSEDETIVERSNENSYVVGDEFLHGLSAGMKELLQPILFKMRKMADIGGLPLSLPDVIAYLSARLERMSFLEILQQNAPDVPPHLLHDIAFAPYQHAVSLAGTGPLRVIVEKMHQQFLQDKAKTFLDACAWWAMMIQEDAIFKRLSFDPMKGLRSCMLVWKNVGAPIIKDKNDGPLAYLTCVAHDVGVLKEFDWNAEDFKKQLLGWIAANMEDRVATLKEKYADMKKEASFVDSKLTAANDLAEAIQKKQRDRVLPTFIKALLSMPSLLSTQQKPYVNGCCMQKLSSSYVADIDWSGSFSTLSTVKQKFGEKRMTKMERPELGAILPRVVAPEPRTIEPRIVPEIEVVSPVTHAYLREWILEFQKPESYSSLMPPEVILKIANDIPHCKVLAQQYLKIVHATIGKKQTNISKILDNLSFHDYVKCLHRIHKVLMVATKQFTSEVELGFLQSAIAALTSFKKQFQKLQILSGEQNIVPLRNVAMMCVVRAMCLPTVPETAQGGVLLVARTVTDNFVKGIVQNTVRNLEQMTEISQMPTVEDVQNFITKMREQQKQTAIDEFEALSIADQELLRQAKKLGLIKKDKVPVQEEEGGVQEEEEADYATTGGDADVPVDDL